MGHTLEKGAENVDLPEIFDSRFARIFHTVSPGFWKEVPIQANINICNTTASRLADHAFSVTAVHELRGF